MTQRKPLTPREIKFVKAKAEGKSNTEAAMIATGTTSVNSAKTQGHRLSTNVNVQQELANAFKKQGISIEAATKPIADGLRATRTVIVRDKAATPEEESNSAFADEVPDHAIRLKAAGMAFNLMGIGKQTGDVTINFISQSSDQRGVYDI